MASFWDLATVFYLCYFSKMKKIFLSSPHSGEKIASETPWVSALDQKVQLRDADRFVDLLYKELVSRYDLEFITAEYNRYVVDLNRSTDHIEALSVEGVESELGKFSKKGLHWVETTQSEVILPKPMSLELHKRLVEKYYLPWHKQVEAAYAKRKAAGMEDVYQLDCHSMPSFATHAHADAGSYRPEVVVSDYLGKSCSSEYKDIVISAFKEHFQDVNYNKPYIGGGITAKYGKPEQGQHCIQIELRRDMYMNEDTKEFLPEKAKDLSTKLEKVIGQILQFLD